MVMLSLASELDGGGWLTPRPDHFTLWIDLVPIVQEAGWVPGLLCTGAENLASTGIRSPNRPTRSESLCRLSHPGGIREEVVYFVCASCLV